MNRPVYWKLALAGLALGALPLLLAGCRAGGSSATLTEGSRYTERELLLPRHQYRLPDVEEELLNPPFLFLVDPGKPLPAAMADAARLDLAEELRATLLRELEREVADLLFD